MALPFFRIAHKNDISPKVPPVLLYTWVYCYEYGRVVRRRWRRRGRVGLLLAAYCAGCVHSCDNAQRGQRMKKKKLMKRREKNLNIPFHPSPPCCINWCSGDHYAMPTLVSLNHGSHKLVAAIASGSEMKRQKRERERENHQTGRNISAARRFGSLETIMKESPQFISSRERPCIILALLLFFYLPVPLLPPPAPVSPTSIWWAQEKNPSRRRKRRGGWRCPSFFGPSDQV